MVLLHGVPTSGWLWSRLGPRLAAAGFGVLAPDLPGLGQSARPQRWTLDAYGAWLEALLDPMGPTHLVGQDFGGLVAAWGASRGLARSLCLVSCPLSRVWWGAKVTARPPLRGPLYRWFAGRLYVMSAVQPSAREALSSGLELGTRDLALRMEAIALALDPAQIAALPERLPPGLRTLLLWGTDDRMFGLRHARSTQRALPGAVLRTISGARHGLPFDHAAAAAAELIPLLKGR